MHDLANPKALCSGACFKATVVPHCKSGSLLEFSAAFPAASAHLMVTNFFQLNFTHL